MLAAQTQGGIPSALCGIVAAGEVDHDGYDIVETRVCAEWPAGLVYNQVYDPAGAFRALSRLAGNGDIAS